MLAVPTQFLFIISHGISWWMVVRANWLGWVRSASMKCFGPQLFLLCTMELFSMEENKFYGYAEEAPDSA